MIRSYVVQWMFMALFKCHVLPGERFVFLWMTDTPYVYYQFITTCNELWFFTWHSLLPLVLLFTFTFMHLADAFIQRDLQCIQSIHILSVCVFPGNRTHNLCAANTMLYHWATGTLLWWFSVYIKGTKQTLAAVCVDQFTGLHADFLV